MSQSHKDEGVAMHLQNPTLLPILITTIFVSHALPPFPFRAHVFVPLILGLAITFHLRPLSADIAQSFGAASASWTFTLHSIALHLSGPAEYTHFRPSIDGSPKAAASYGLLQKLGWTLSLLTSPRGIGWTPTYNRPAPDMSVPPTRSAYTLWALKRTAGLYLILDLARTYALYRPSISTRSVELADCLQFGFCAWAGIEMQYCLMSALAVGSGISAPQDWPRLFGRLRDAYTVGRMWGSTWHQLLRGSIVSLARTLGITSRLACIILAFTVSTVGHCATLITISKPGHRVWLGQVLFFESQGIAIIVEMLVMRAWGGGKRKGDKERVEVPTKWKVVGYIWTATIILGATRWQILDIEEVGMNAIEPVPYSIVRALLGAMGAWNPAAGVASSVTYA